MKRDFLEKIGIAKEVIEQIMAENGRDIEAEKNKRVSAEENAEALKKQLETSQAELAKIQKSGANAEELKGKVSELQQKLEEDSKAHAKALRDKDIAFAVDKAIRDANGINAKAIKALLNDADSFDFDKDGNIKGLSEQLKALSEADDSKMLFKTEQAPKIKGMTPPSGSSGLPGGNDDNFINAAMRGAGLTNDE